MKGRLITIHTQTIFNLNAMRTIREIIIHCSATEYNLDFRAADIDRWHKAKGWNGIGYHFVIDLDGTIEPGRAIAETGAHCQHHNAYSIGICYIGGMINGKPEDTRTWHQKIALRHLVSTLLHCYPTIWKISGHREYSNKACPCFDVASEFMKGNRPFVYPVLEG